MHARHSALAVSLAVLALLMLTIGAAGSAVAADHHDEPAFVVDLDADGDATVTSVLTYDFESDTEQEAFEDLSEDDEAQSEFRDRFEERKNGIAEGAAEETDREMSVSDAEVELYTTDDVGVVELSVRWHGLAAVDDDSVTVTEPFASGFTPDHQFVLVGPDEYEPTTVTPEASDSDDRTLIWGAGTDLDGFEVTFTADNIDEEDDEADDVDEEDDEEDAEAADDDGPGFGIGIGLVAFLAATVGIVRRISA